MALDLCLHRRSGADRYLVALWVPESPLYLLRQGKQAELRGVLNLVLRTNGKSELPVSLEIQQPQMAKEGIILAAPPSAYIFDPARLVPGLNFLLWHLHLAAGAWLRRALAMSVAMGPRYRRARAIARLCAGRRGVEALAASRR